ncbi:hypothetical protein [Aquitalea aquatilis]|uniref:hypothetical protein n=1 Tax=Aquitalea aquatilis TaxID=1537400 RepID=UPI0010BD30E3|nr:hypothetical protein [Aquitalea aquatilis]
MQLQTPLAGIVTQLLLCRMEPPVVDTTPTGKRMRPTALLKKRLETVGQRFTADDLASATGLTREGAKGIISDSQHAGLICRVTKRSCRAAVYEKLGTLNE